MKINLVSYLDPFIHHGGGEMVVRRLVEVGQERGHEFKFTSARGRKSEYDETADFDWLIDIFNYPETLKSRGSWIRLDMELLASVIEKRRFIHMTNAYADVCNLGYLPCNGSQKDICEHKSPLRISRNLAARDFSYSCSAINPLVRKSFTNSKANIYVSPLHQKISSKILQIDDSKKSIILRPIINVQKFYNSNVERDIENLFVGVISEAKGLQQMREQFSGKELILVGDIHPNVKLDFGTYLGKLSYDQIPLLMNRAKNFIFLPRWPEPQGRVVVEAALTGCKLIVNENVGALSFPFDLSNPENVQDSERIFWEEIESAML